MASWRRLMLIALGACPQSIGHTHAMATPSHHAKTSTQIISGCSLRKSIAISKAGVRSPPNLKEEQVHQVHNPHRSRTIQKAMPPKTLYVSGIKTQKVLASDYLAKPAKTFANMRGGEYATVSTQETPLAMALFEYKKFSVFPLRMATLPLGGNAFSGKGNSHLSHLAEL